MRSFNGLGAMVTLVGGALFGARADAYQCRPIDAVTASRAVELMQVGKSYVELCEPCGQTTPTAAQVVQSTQVQSEGDGLVVTVNGVAVDLASVYVEQTAGLFLNVGQAAGCNAVGVTTQIRVEAALAKPRASDFANQPPAQPPAPSAPPAPSGDRRTFGEFVTGAIDTLETRAATADSRPLDVWVMVTNAHDVAVAEKGSLMVGVGDLAAGLGLSDSVESQVYDEIVRQAHETFRTEGVAVEISHGVYDMASIDAHGWRGSTPTTSRVSAGSYEVMRVTVLDPIGTARAEKGDLMVGLGLTVGMDIDAKVRETVEQRVCSALAENGVQSLILPFKSR